MIALQLLDVMREKNMTINLITYNSAITALSKAAKQSSKSSSNNSHSEDLWPKVLPLLDQMEADGLEPDGKNASVIRVSDALRLSHKLPRLLLLLPGFSYSAAISCCSQGRWKEALDLLERMKEGGVRPNKVAYTSAIVRCVGLQLKTVRDFQKSKHV